VVRSEKLIELGNVSEMQYQIFFNTSQDANIVPQFPTEEDLKKENQVRQVRTPGSFGSAKATDVRTSLTFKIPLIFMNLSRGEKRLWVDFGHFRLPFYLVSPDSRTTLQCQFDYRKV